MKTITHITDPKQLPHGGKRGTGEFNMAETLFLALDPGKVQTISVRLPNGRFVTCSFIPGSSGETECMDIHYTGGKEFQSGDGRTFQKQAVVGFTVGNTAFDTRKISGDVSLTTLLLSAADNK